MAKYLWRRQNVFVTPPLSPPRMKKSAEYLATTSFLRKQSRQKWYIFVKMWDLFLPYDDSKYGFDGEYGTKNPNDHRDSHVDVCGRCRGDRPIPQTQAVAGTTILVDDERAPLPIDGLGHSASAS